MNPLDIAKLVSTYTDQWGKNTELDEVLTKKIMAIYTQVMNEKEKYTQVMNEKEKVPLVFNDTVPNDFYSSDSIVDGWYLFSYGYKYDDDFLYAMKKNRYLFKIDNHEGIQNQCYLGKLEWVDKSTIPTAHVLKIYEIS